MASEVSVVDGGAVLLGLCFWGMAVQVFHGGAVLLENFIVSG